jgi:hypothetical protein
MHLVAYTDCAGATRPLFAVVVHSIDEARRIARKSLTKPGPCVSCFEIEIDGRYRPFTDKLTA